MHRGQDLLDRIALAGGDRFDVGTVANVILRHGKPSALILDRRFKAGLIQDAQQTKPLAVLNPGRLARGLVR